MRISDWSSDVSLPICAGDGLAAGAGWAVRAGGGAAPSTWLRRGDLTSRANPAASAGRIMTESVVRRSEEHTSELQSLMRISYAVFCLHKKMKPIRTASTYLKQ